MSAKRIPRWTGRIALVFGSDRFLDQLCIQAIGVGIYVHENGNRIHQENRPDCAFPGVCGDNDFVSRAEFLRQLMKPEWRRCRYSRTGRILRCELRRISWQT